MRGRIAAGPGAEQLQLLGALLDAMPVMVIWYESDGRVRLLNPAFAAATGWSAGEPGGTDPTAACHPDPAPRAAVLENLTKAAGTWREVVLTRRDGSAFLTSWTSMCLADGSHVAFGVDIAPRQLREDALEAGIGLPGFALAETPAGDFIGHRYAETGSRKHEEQLRLAQEAVGAGTWEWDVITGESVWSPEHCRQLGLAENPGPLTWELWLSRLHPEDRDRTDAAFAAALAGAGRFVTEYRASRPEGGWRWLESHGRIIRDASGRAVRVVGFVMDISRRKEAEQALRASEQRARAQLAELEAIYDQAPIGLGLLDRELRFVRINRHLAEINGPSVEEHLGRVAWEIVPDLQAAAEPLFRRVLETGRPITGIEFEGETPRAPGVRRSWVEQFYPLKDPEGQAVAAGVICQEVTEQKRADRALRESEERFRQIAETIDDVVWIAEPSVPRVIYVNPAFERVWGIPAEAIYRQFDQWIEAVHPEDRGRVRDALAASVLGGDYEAEYRIVRPDGQTRWIHDRGHLVRTGEGTATRSAGVAVDITERKRAEQHRELLLTELSHRVKNMLAVVQSIARQTAGRVATVPVFVETFGGRLRALAAAHDLITATGWQGARLGALVERALSSYLTGAAEHFELDVEDATVDPALAQNLTLALHELATNAVKHGALSVPQGRVALLGRVERDEIVLVWRETGGPAVAPPTRSGFGTMLLSRVITGQHQGRVELDWRGEGLVCTMRLPRRPDATPPGSS